MRLRAMNKIQATTIMAALFTLALSVVASTTPAHAQGPDFVITGTPTGQCINLGATASYTVTVSSLGGFQGTVQLEDSVDPNVVNGSSLSSIPSTVSVSAGHDSTFDLTASTTQSTPNQVYAITIYGLAGITVHSATVYLAFQPLCGATGGTVEPVNVIGALAPYVAIAASIVGLGVATSAQLYVKRRKTA